MSDKNTSHSNEAHTDKNTSDIGRGDIGRGDIGWAERPGFIKLFLIGLVFASIGAALAGFVPAWHNPHPHFNAEKIPVFFALWGFASFMFIVLVGQHLRKFISRKKGYYDEHE